MEGRKEGQMVRSADCLRDRAQGDREIDPHRIIFQRDANIHLSWKKMVFQLTTPNITIRFCSHKMTTSSYQPAATRHRKTVTIFCPMLPWLTENSPHSINIRDTVTSTTSSYLVSLCYHDFIPCRLIWELMVISEMYGIRCRHRIDEEWGPHTTHRQM